MKAYILRKHLHYSLEVKAESAKQAENIAYSTPDEQWDLEVECEPATETGAGATA